METDKRHRSSKSIALLLLEDVDNLGRSGDLVSVKPGFARNLLVPKGKAAVADRHVLKMQKKLQEERATQAAEDKKVSETLATQINGLSLETHVKVDPEGHMYGSVSSADIVELLSAKGVTVEKRFVQLPQPIKKTGELEIHLRLKEDVECSFKLNVVAEQEEEANAEA
jgi:large subunit ribosomal protein L9